MASKSKQLALLRDAVGVIVRRVSVLPPSPEVEALRVRAQDCQVHLETWDTRPPTAAEREALMKRVLGLHVELAKLERWTT